MRDEVDELALEQVRVLELVDHHDAEAQPRRLAYLLVVPKEIASRELEVLEVDDRLAPLRERVLGGEALEQLLEKHAIGCRELFQRGLLERLARVLVRGGACSAALERREVDDALRRGALRRDPARLGRVAPLRVRCARVLQEAGGLRAERGQRVLEARALTRARGRAGDPPSAASRRRP